MSEAAIPGSACDPGAASITAAELAAIVGVDQDTAARLLEVVKLRVERYAPDAPTAMKNQSILRGIGWLKDSASPVSKETVGPLAIERTVNTASWFLSSGAASLLSPWKVRRGGAV